MTNGGDARLGRLGVWGHLDTLTIDALRRYAARVDELGYATLWVPETVGRDPFVLLGLIAGSTAELRLGTSIASVWGRDPQTMRMSALSLQEATDGRFVLGLGVSHPHLAEKLRGHRFERPLSLMREFLQSYRGAIYKGPMPDGLSEPPVLIAALRERMLELAATATDGAFPYLVSAQRVAWIRERLNAALPSVGAEARRPLLAVTLPIVIESEADAARGAARAYLAPYLRTPTYRASWEAQGFDADDWEKPGSDRLVDAMVAWGDVHALHDRVGELYAAGADHVALIPLSPDGSTEALATLEAMAG
jgi:probable F420-dependent oxidoreductase